MPHSDPEMQAQNERFIMKAKMENRLKKLEVESQELQNRGLKIQQKINILVQQKQDIQDQFVGARRSIREFESMMKELFKDEKGDKP